MMSISMSPRRSHLLVAAALLALAASSSAPVSAQDRTFELRNLCQETLWVGGLNVPGYPDAGWELPGSCVTDADCPSETGARQHCDPATHSCVLSLSVASSAAAFNVWARTGCEFQGGLCAPTSRNCCATGGCTDAMGRFALACASGPKSPVTVAEATLQTGGMNDFYDVSTIDGFNVGIELAASGGTTCPMGFGDCDYWCGNPGSPSPATALAPCIWTAVLDHTCDGATKLRAVAVTSDCSSDADCPSGATCDTGRGACMCEHDVDCDSAAGEICGLPNDSFPGYKACGPFAGCTNHKALCGFYFAKGIGGDACADGGQCASGVCTASNTCQASSVDAIATFCNTRHGRTVPDPPAQCTADDQCPLLVGSSVRHCSDCPADTTCETLAGGTNSCRLDCVSGKCALVDCTSDADCTTLDGTFMLCDLESGSATFQKCVSTNASLFAASGLNGQSCYSSPDGGMNPSPDVTTLCGGCPTDPSDPLSACWPATGDTCFETNPDWAGVVQPEIKSFKLACPSAYSFPFDDPTSTFQCRSGMTNAVDYTLTFCPVRTLFADGFESGDTAAWSATVGKAM